MRMNIRCLERMRGSLLAGAVLTAVVVCAAQAQVTVASGSSARVDSRAGFTLISPDIADAKEIPETQVFNSLGCTGRNISPALSWSHVPDGTQSFALLVHDPDAPMAGGWWHWMVYNIPGNVTSLPADAGNPAKHLMPGTTVQGRSDFGTPGYGGPCPPPGKPHHYYFRLYALKVAKLDVPPGATPAIIGARVNANSLGEAQIMGLYGR
jgi:Raf kinase inhibitor-like YbhB/YbcL family protein